MSETQTPETSLILGSDPAKQEPKSVTAKRVPSYDLSDIGEDQVARIMASIADNDPVDAICKREGMSRGKFYWMLEVDHHGSAERYLRARTQGADKCADQIMILSDMAVGLASDRNSRPDALRVAMQGYQWAAAVRNPRAYSLRNQVELSGPDGKVPVFSVTVQSGHSEGDKKEKP